MYKIHFLEIFGERWIEGAGVFPALAPLSLPDYVPARRFRTRAITAHSRDNEQSSNA
jgi:hypothetical protein